MYSIKKIAIGFSLIVASISVYQAQAQDAPGDVADLVGAKAGSGETILSNRLYELKKTETSGDDKYQYWWNKHNRQCISVRVHEGRYAAIMLTGSSDCGETSDVDNNTSTNDKFYESLVDARASSGEGELERKGYVLKKTENSGDTKYQYWWNDSKKECLTIRISEGRYASITPTEKFDCSQN